MDSDLTLMFTQFVPEKEEQDLLAKELVTALQDLGIQATIDTTSIAMARSEGGRILHEVALYLNGPVGTAILGAATGKVLELLFKWTSKSLSRQKQKGEGPDKELDRRVVIYGPDHSVVKAAVVHSDGTVTEYKTSAAASDKEKSRNKQ